MAKRQTSTGARRYRVLGALMIALGVVVLAIVIALRFLGGRVENGYWQEFDGKEYNYVTEKWEKFDSSDDTLFVIKDGSLTRYDLDQDDKDQKKKTYTATQPLKQDRRINPFTRAIVNSYTTKDYAKELREYFGKQDSDGAYNKINELIDNYGTVITTKYRLEEGDLIIETFDNQGKKNSQIIYKKVPSKYITLKDY